MTLYNMLSGVDADYKAVLNVLGLTTDDVPRFRDAYVDRANNRLVIYTRTGGGNRDYYESAESCSDHYPEYFGGENQPTGPWNSDLRKVSGFLYDEDDDFDCTYASFYYAIPAATEKNSGEA